MEKKLNKKGMVAVIALAFVILVGIIVLTFAITDMIKEGNGGVLKEDTTQYTLAGVTNNNEEKSTLINWDETNGNNQDANGGYNGGYNDGNIGGNIGGNVGGNAGGNADGNVGGNVGGNAGGNSGGNAGDNNGGFFSNLLGNLFGGSRDDADDAENSKVTASQNSNSNNPQVQTPQNSNSNNPQEQNPQNSNSNNPQNSDPNKPQKPAPQNTNPDKPQKPAPQNSNPNNPQVPTSQNSNIEAGDVVTIPTTTKKSDKNDPIAEYEELTKNGDNVLSDHHNNKYIKLVSSKFGIKKELLVAIYSVPDTGNNFVLEFSGKRDKDGNVIKSPDTLTRVYQIDKNKNITVATGKVKGNIGVSYAEGTLCFNMIKTIVMPQYPEYFTGVEK